MTKPEEMSYERFCMLNKLTDRADVFGHIYASQRSCPTTKSFHRWNNREVNRLMREQEESFKLWRKAIASGEILEPKEPTLDEQCEGMPDLACTQAAIRVREILKAHGKYREGMA